MCDLNLNYLTLLYRRCMSGVKARAKWGSSACGKGAKCLTGSRRLAHGWSVTSSTILATSPSSVSSPAVDSPSGFKGPLRGTSIVTWPPTVEAHSHSRPPIATKSTPTARSRESGGGRSSAAGSRDSILVSNLTQYSLSLCKNFARNVTRGLRVVRLFKFTCNKICKIIKQLHELCINVISS